jgi:hypothetical protein
MLVLKSSAVLRSSKRKRPSGAVAERRGLPAPFVEVAAAAGAIAAVALSALAWVQMHGYTLYYGDAEAHLNIARRFVESRTPGYDQVGTVWLPLPHALMLPFILNDWLWRTGLAGALPAFACFVLAALGLYLVARRVFDSRAAAATGAALLVLNPNVLYLQSIPMTEAVFFAGLLGMLFGTLWFRRSGSLAAVVTTACFSIAASLTRYEGWFLIPFVTAYFALIARRPRAAILFGALASLAPLYWLAHNAWYYGDPLEFYRGPYSAKATYQRALDAGQARYPGDRDWSTAWQYFCAAVGDVAGRPLVWLGVAGLGAALLRRRWWPAAYLALTPAFYVMSMYSSGTPIFIPELPPHSYYNTRYATAAIPLLAFGGAALAAVLPLRLRPAGAVALVLAAISPWLLRPNQEHWICWKESQVNSVARRAWTREAAQYLAARYHPGQGIFTSFGDLMGIYREAGISFRETLNDSNGRWWNVAYIYPQRFLNEKWAVAIAGDPVSRLLKRLPPAGPRYDLVKRVEVPGADAVEIYRRRNADPLHEGAWIAK